MNAYKVLYKNICVLLNKKCCLSAAVVSPSFLLVLLPILDECDFHLAVAEFRSGNRKKANY